MRKFAVIAALLLTTPVYAGAPVAMYWSCNHPDHGGGWQRMSDTRMYRDSNACWAIANAHKHMHGSYRVQCSYAD